MIDVMQLIAAALWLSVLAVRGPAVARVIRQRPRDVFDFYSALLAGMGAVQTGFTLRWWLYPQAKAAMEPGELTLWGSLYLASALVAAASHAVPRRNDG